MGGGNAEEKSKGAQSRLNFYSCFLKNPGSENAITPTPPWGAERTILTFSTYIMIICGAFSAGSLQTYCDNSLR